MRINQLSSYLVSVILLCLVSFSTMIQAEDSVSSITEINVTSEAWENATNKDGTGLYWDIIRRVYEPAGVNVMIDTTSYSRAVALVKQNKMDVWVGSYLGEEQDIIYPKSHFDADVVAAIFVKKPNTSWQGEKSLEGKNVGWIKGYELHEYLDTNFIKRELSDRESVLKLLKAGRLDYFLDAVAELNTYFTDSLKQDSSLSIETIKHLNLYLGFSNTLKGQALADIFDDRFEKIKNSGELKKLFEKWGFTYIF